MGWYGVFSFKLLTAKVWEAYFCENSAVYKFYKNVIVKISKKWYINNNDSSYTGIKAKEREGYSYEQERDS